MAQNIKQLYSLDLNRANAFIPRTTADSVEGLEEMLSGFNMYSVAYTGSVESTRLSVPERLRRQGLWITYVKYDNTTITERYDHNDISPNEWKKTENWRNSVDLFGGTIEIGLNGNWFINGIDTGKKAVGSLEYPTLFILPSMHLYLTSTPSSVEFNVDETNGHLVLERDISDIFNEIGNS